MKEFLIKINACYHSIQWAGNKTWQEIYTTCHRGDWLSYLFAITNPKDIQLLILVNGHIANTVRHLMKDERRIKAVDTAIAFGEGKATIQELAEAYDAAVTNAVYDAARAGAYAAGDAAYEAGDDAKISNQLLTANICRKYLPIEIWNIPHQ